MGTNDQKYIQRAIELARYAMNSNLGGPFGAVVVKNGNIVGEGFNQVTSRNDPTAHAEILAIRDACSNLNTHELSNCVIYSSCEPCPMCLGAIYWSHIEKVFYGYSSRDAALAGFDDQLIYRELQNDREGRRIRMIKISLDTDNQLFAQWMAKPDRLTY